MEANNSFIKRKQFVVVFVRKIMKLEHPSYLLLLFFLHLVLMLGSELLIFRYIKPVLSGHSKLDKTKVLKTNSSLMKVESIAECSPWSILQCF